MKLKLNKKRYVHKQRIYNQQTDEQNSYRIDALWLEKSSPKKQDIYIKK